MSVRFSSIAFAALAAAMLLPVEANALPGAGSAAASPSLAKSTVEKVGYRYRYNRRYYRDHGSYVRAPFTEVDTRRGTWVAAPFARVHSGQRGTWGRAPFANLWGPR
jgi:hypothetical protein